MIHEAFALAANLAFAQPKNPFGLNGWAHLYNQVVFLRQCREEKCLLFSQAEIGRMGGIRLIINAMKEHITHWPIQDRGIRALANLAYNSTDNIMVATSTHMQQSSHLANAFHSAAVAVRARP